MESRLYKLGGVHVTMLINTNKHQWYQELQGNKGKHISSTTSIYQVVVLEKINCEFLPLEFMINFVDHHQRNYFS
jgi:hypothetical protein